MKNVGVAVTSLASAVSTSASGMRPVNSHTPFSPTAPYQPDWTRLLSAAPFTQDDVDHAYEAEPDWMNLGPGYADAVAYAYTTFAGYVRKRAAHDYVMILIGDHQPPAIVSGNRAPWDVPIHVITNRRDILDGLLARGFTRGLTPGRPHLGQMHEAVPILLEAFSSGTAAAQLPLAATHATAVK